MTKRLKTKHKVDRKEKLTFGEDQSPFNARATLQVNMDKIKENS